MENIAPSNYEDGRTHSTAVESSREHSKPRVLVVDDDNALRFHARQVLEYSGFEVTEIGDGNSALALTEKENFDAILLDVRMPGIDGFSTCSRIRSNPDGALTPIIVVTADGDDEAIEQALQSGATDFEVKPINWSKLKNRVRYLINARHTAIDLITEKNHRTAIVDAIPDTLLKINRAGEILDIKHPRYGFDIQSIEVNLGDNLIDHLPQETALDLTEALKQSFEKSFAYNFSWKIQHLENSIFLDARVIAIDEESFVIMLRDFTERHYAEKQISRLAFFDKVTGLPNQDQLVKVLSEVEDKHIPICVVRLTIVGFEHAKSILGLEKFKTLEKMLSERILELIRALGSSFAINESNLFRLSESEFAIISTDLKSEVKVTEFVRHLSQTVNAEYTLEGYELKLEAVAGIAMSVKVTDKADTVLDDAELALASCTKTSSKAPLFFTPELRETSEHRANLGKELRIAVENGDLHLHYQPKVDSVSRSILGVEALLRWSRKDGRMVSPAEFIPLAEQSGLILGIGEFVVNEACRQNQDWYRACRRTIPIAVNFSGHQFDQPAIVTMVRNALSSSSLAAESLEIELTETVALENSDKIRGILSEFREMGVETAIDDFGTGYSSLKSLSQFPFQTLKIDRSFVVDLATNPIASSICRALIDMSHTLGMKVVAEGVEEESQLEMLRGLNCDIIQGYLTGRPSPPEAIQAML